MMIHFGEKLERLLEQIGMNKTELAKKAGINKSYVTNICKGEKLKKPKNPTLKVFDSITLALGVRMEDILRIETQEDAKSSKLRPGTRLLSRMKLSKLHFKELLEAEKGRIPIRDIYPIPVDICDSFVAFVVEIDAVPESPPIKLGDHLIVEPDAAWIDGQLCLILIKNAEKPVFRRPYQRAKQIRIRSDDPDIPEEVYSSSEIRVYPVTYRITKDF